MTHDAIPFFIAKKLRAWADINQAAELFSAGKQDAVPEPVTPVIGSVHLLLQKQLACLRVNTIGEFYAQTNSGPGFASPWFC